MEGIRVFWCIFQGLEVGRRGKLYLHFFLSKFVTLK